MSGELAGRLNQRIVIEQPSAVRTDSGLQVAGWAEVARCLAEVVPEGAGPETEGMALAAMPRFRVTLRRRDEVAVGQRLMWAGRVLMIRQRLDDPRQPDRMVLRCEEARS